MSYEVRIVKISVIFIHLLVFCWGNWNDTDCNPKWEMTPNVGEFKCYKLYTNSSAFTWEKAREYCASQNGRLAAVKNEEQRNFLTHMLLSENVTEGTEVWLGGFAAQVDWKWIDGTKVEDNSYKNWEGLNSDGFGKSCVSLLPYYQTHDHLQHLAGKWRLTSCSFRIGSLCEYKKSSEGYSDCQKNVKASFTRNDICYEMNIDKTINYYEAIEDCEKNDGQLAKITSQEWTNAFIEKSNETFNLPIPREPIWIGLSKAVWKWDIAKGEDVINKFFWAPNHPKDQRLVNVITNGNISMWVTKSIADTSNNFVCEFNRKNPLWTEPPSTAVVTTIYLNTTAETAPPEQTENSSNPLGLGAVLGITAGGSVVLFTIIGIAIYFWRRMSKVSKEEEKKYPKKDKPLPVPPPTDTPDTKNNPISIITTPTLNPPPEDVVADYVNISKEISATDNLSSIPPVIPPRSNLTTDNVQSHNSNFNQVLLSNWGSKNGSTVDGQSVNGPPALTLEKVIVRTQPPPASSSSIPDPPPIASHSIPDPPHPHPPPPPPPPPTENAAAPEKKPKPKKNKKEKYRQPDAAPTPIIKNSGRGAPQPPPIPPKDFLTGMPQTDLKSKWNLTSPNITLPPPIPPNPPHYNGKGVDIRKEDSDQWLWLEGENPPNVVVFPKREHFP
ncbi:DgyrCDS1480 [Dimorphilus gyrociliatus]|uniref:DgyrCDS1480 n=1 Tax=Dimorphilus gyrociliatus TaxID=2664684 RepID=A0A7I8V7D7_9ANNE|nr:DgyrCDS1480 [Dimorphilus gyrociliatus]